MVPIGADEGWSALMVRGGHELHPSASHLGRRVRITDFEPIGSSEPMPSGIGRDARRKPRHKSVTPKKNRLATCVANLLIYLAPRPGLEPGTYGLTDHIGTPRSTKHTPRGTGSISPSRAPHLLASKRGPERGAVELIGCRLLHKLIKLLIDGGVCSSPVGTKPLSSLGKDFARHLRVLRRVVDGVVDALHLLRGKAREVQGRRWCFGRRAAPRGACVAVLAFWLVHVGVGLSVGGRGRGHDWPSTTPSRTRL